MIDDHHVLCICTTAYNFAANVTAKLNFTVNIKKTDAINRWLYY